MTGLVSRTRSTQHPRESIHKDNGPHDECGQTGHQDRSGSNLQAAVPAQIWLLHPAREKAFRWHC